MCRVDEATASCASHEPRPTCEYRRMIRQLVAADIDAFIVHADKQAAENGRGATVRFALREPGKARDLNRVRQSIEEGLQRPVGEAGWYRIWIADDGNEIIA